MSKKDDFSTTHVPIWQIVTACAVVGTALLGPAFYLQGRINRIYDTQESVLSRITIFEKNQTQLQQEVAAGEIRDANLRMANERLQVELCSLIQETNLEHATETKDKALLWYKVYKQDYPSATIFFPGCESTNAVAQGN